jgi:hypothetical protein
MVSSNDLKEMRKKFHSMISTYDEMLENAINDSENASREMVYSSENSIVMLGFGDKEEYSEVTNDVFHKTMVHIDGKFEVRFKDGEVIKFDERNTHLEIPPMKDFKAISTEDNSVSLTILRKLAPLILIVLLLSCSITYETTKTTKLKVDKKQQTTEENETKQKF